jgi:hypothetical protein
MRRDRLRKLEQLPWKSQVQAALAELDYAKTSNQRVAALRRLRLLFVGGAEPKKVLRRCLSLIRRIERLEAWHIRTCRELLIRF